jgi:hypothetical protein
MGEIVESIYISASTGRLAASSRHCMYYARFKDWIEEAHKVPPGIDLKIARRS